MFPAGRLDKDSEGFVLITDDGALAHRMLSPKSHVPKTYRCVLEKPCGADYPDAFAAGITLSGGDICMPALCIPDAGDPFSCTVIIREGMFHQVKRMFAALGNHVNKLKRTAIGGLELNANLALGEHLLISHKDVEKLLSRKGL
ncbi:MAG: pseudouridine synthase [Oscillospiraceae bacterium]